MAHLLRSRRATLTAVDVPMLLVSQVQRSGGSLVAALLDGHQELLVHPWELLIGPAKGTWPAFDMDAGVEGWLDLLREERLADVFRVGYRKDVKHLKNPWDATAALPPFELPPSFVERLFRVLVADRPPTTDREVTDRYLTAFFAAWLDHQGGWDAPKRWVAAFCPRMAWGDSGERWRACYPDGRLLCVLRDPRGWFASASRHAATSTASVVPGADDACDLWLRGAREMAQAKERWGDDVLIVSYERLVAEPERVMRRVAEWAQIAWHPLLAVPTFNRHPVPANSSLAVAPVGEVVPAFAESWRDHLTTDVQRAVEDATGAVFAEVSQLVGA